MASLNSSFMESSTEQVFIVDLNWICDGLFPHWSIQSYSDVRYCTHLLINTYKYLFGVVGIGYIQCTLVHAFVLTNWFHCLCTIKIVLGNLNFCLIRVGFWDWLWDDRLTLIIIPRQMCCCDETCHFIPTIDHC